MDLTAELREIGDLITSAAFIVEVRREVAKVAKDGFVVTGNAGDREGCSVEVKCDEETHQEVTRRIRGSIPDAHVEKIAEGLLGISLGRRGASDG